MAITLPTPDMRKAAEFTFDYIIVPLAAFAVVDTFLVTSVQMLPVPVAGLSGWIIGIGFAWRSEERRVGKECKSQCRSRWSPYH